MNNHNFLAGYRVLDLSQYIPGPFATRMLSDLGADVIKVEPPRGDPMRNFMLSDNAMPSALYRHLNRGKRIVRLDLKTDQGKAELSRLIKQADVLLESFRPGVMDRLGFDCKRLEQLNPQLIHCALSGFGQNGPYRDHAGHDLTYCAASGALSATGTSEQPVMIFPPLADHAGAMQAVNTIQAALLGRVKSNKGAFIDISLFDSAMAWQYLGLSEAEEKSGVQREQLLLNGGAACYNIYQTADGQFFALAPLEAKFWQAFCEAVDRTAWIPRHLENMPQTTLIAELRELFLSQPLEHWQQLLEGVDCCFEIIPTLDQIKQHPQVEARGLLNDWEPNYPAWIDGAPCKNERGMIRINEGTSVEWLPIDSE